MVIGIINYGMGNLRSVANAFESFGCATAILEQPEDLSSVDRVVLPGVGAFADGMKKLHAGGWVPALETQVRDQEMPFLGLCLGMQLLASRGTEHGSSDGLGWIPGEVRRLKSNDPQVRIPHIGWNDVEVVKRDGLYAETGEEPTFYYVHSYAFEPEDDRVVSAYCTHGERFVASVELGNVYATQFHPEKSQKCGLALLRNFLSI